MRYRACSALLVAAVLVGCAGEVVRQPVELNASVPEAGRLYTLRNDVEVRLESNYTRIIRAHTEFSVAGSLPQGTVLRPTQTVLTVEGRHMHEAYAVLRDDRLVGFYLPVEKAFSPLPLATSFPLVQRKD
ncbi:hypothetical protein [Piscinibacter sp. XHJ-5]|uniref:hypothetical protein n=1 Tax=Piscinibacter sp. XHJ-5 TaxID=3037797 RepID=UPI0024532314|nr:hypothetical protein [Piscinibacter sp. XHJ-5]